MAIGDEFMNEARGNGTHVTDAFNRFTSAETAKWWIKNKEITEDDPIQIYSIILPKFEANTTLDSFGELTSNGTITVEPITVELRNNGPSVMALSTLTTGTNLSTIIIERTGNIETNKVVLQSFRFGNCHISRWWQTDDHVWFSFSFEEFQNTRNKYLQDGTSGGHIATRFNVTEITSQQSGG